MPSVLITGANRGIGLELTRQYVGDGWSVYATCRNPDAADELKAIGGPLRVLAMDVSDLDQVRATAKAMERVAIDVLINNAGTIDAQSYGTVAYEKVDDPDLRNYDYDEWIRVLQTNLLGPARVCGEFVDHLAAGERPIAVMMSSGIGSITNTWQAGRYAYRTSKAGLNMLTRGIGPWYEQQGIIIVSISPGWTRTGMGGSKGVNSAEQAASGVRKVIASATKADTGKFFNFDGSIIPW